MTNTWNDMQREHEEFKKSVESAMNFPFYIIPIFLFIFGICLIILVRYCQTHPNACCSPTPLRSQQPPPMIVTGPMVELSPQHPRLTPDSNFFNSPSPRTHQYPAATAPLLPPNGYSQLAPDSYSAGSSSPVLPHQPPMAPAPPGWCLPGAEIGPSPGTAPVMNYGAAASAGGANDKPPMYADVVMGNFDLVATKQPDVKATVPEIPPPEYPYSKAGFHSASDGKK